MLGILIYLSFSNLGSEDNHKSHENSDKKRTDVKKNKKQSSSKDKNKSHENNDRSLKIITKTLQIVTNITMIQA
ncbi:hypothetical protein [Staphylococcus epidermidis]|uniref:hypothetical protein n=1 Tax=Staphylococcus epidermidis TaxID=1282 RepID=UPI001C575032|nr:hypothetical protein [Staphylococcus epidermidis]QXU91405.1 hypothetical protein KFV31_13350 [Staphylococcus epidermidis]